MKAIYVLLLMIVGGLVAAKAGEAPQPHMVAATDALQAARDSKEPIPLLEKARTELEHAKHNKAGRRPEAIEAVNEAIEQVKKGEDATAKITHAIAMVRAGMDHGR